MASMPVLFVGHGSPTNIVEENRFTRGWREMAADLPRPRAVLCISAHLYGRGNTVTGAQKPGTLHDFYGFPEALYRVDYPAPGAPELARQVADLLPEVTIDPRRGLDHGAWSVLHFMYPEAEVPVVQLSVNAQHTPQQSYDTGQALRPLREEGVLILGSGDVVHNLALIEWDRAEGFTWADVFDDYIQRAVVEGRHQDAIQYRRAGPASMKAFIYRDHYDPLLYALGAARPEDGVEVFNDARVLGSLSMTSYRFS